MGNTPTTERLQHLTNLGFTVAESRAALRHTDGDDQLRQDYREARAQNHGNMQRIYAGTIRSRMTRDEFRCIVSENYRRSKVVDRTQGVLVYTKTQFLDRYGEDTAGHR